MNIALFKGGRAAWDELKYCLRSIDKYIPDANVSIYSDSPVDWIQNVEFVEMNRYKKDRPLENFWDTEYKQLYYAEHHEGPYLYVHDDMLFLKPFDPEIFDNIALQKVENGDEKQRTDRHGRTINKAIEMLNIVGVDVYNYESHTPRLYDCSKMRQLYDTFDILNQDVPPAIATLYYNYYNEAPKQVLTEKNDLRASFTFEESTCDDGCYIALNEGEIIDLCSNKYICHFNDVGLRFSPWGIPILQNYISALFPDKCRFEK